jgi:hypothetical protein
MPVGCQPDLKILAKGKQDAEVGVGGANQQLIQTSVLLRDILAPIKFNLKREFTKRVVGSEVIHLQVCDIIGSSNDMELELEHCWDLGLTLKVPKLGLEDAHHFAILIAIHVTLGTGVTALLPALQLPHCSGNGIDRHILGGIDRA